MRGSLRFRLALWCGGIICSVVILVALYGYAVASRAQYDELDRLLRNVTEHVAGELAQSKSEADRARVLSGADGLRIGILLYDSEQRRVSGDVLFDSSSARRLPAFDLGSVLAGAGRMPYGLLAGLAPALRPAAPSRGAFGLVEKDRERWRIYVHPVELPMRVDAASARYVVGTASLTELDMSLRRVGLFMMMIAVLGNIITFATGWWLAGRALHPVLALTESASTIARSGEFSQRVAADMPRDELGRLAETFNEMLERLERLHSAQARFVSDASHELRAPLSVIQANLELLEHQSAMSVPERKSAVREAHMEASRLGRLVADLLVLARADVGIPMRREPVELDRVIMDVLGEARHLASGQRIEVGALEPAIASGEPDRLHQLVLNLVENAIKYTPADGHITVALLRRGEFAEIEVRDTGIGIPANDLPHVFERFYRSDRARTRAAGGTGLGLSIALWIARQHGGDIALTSELGHGTVATARLPIKS